MSGAASRRVVVGGRYELSDRIGAGGMGEVWRARVLGGAAREVALKLTLPLALEDGVGLLHREAAILARLSHPAIPAVLDVGVDAIRGGFLAMELRRGISLARIAVDAPPPWPALASVADQILGALAYAHARGVIHRDIKPGNVLVARGEAGAEATLLDFGVAALRDLALGERAEADAHRDDRLSEIVAGSRRFMAPEQADPNRAGEVGPATDLYAVGLLLRTVVEGRLPEPVGERAQPPENLRPRSGYGVPDGLEALLGAWLRPDPEERPACAAEAIAALRALEGGGRTTAAVEETKGGTLRSPSARGSGAATLRHANGEGEGPGHRADELERDGRVQGSDANDDPRERFAQSGDATVAREALRRTVRGIPLALLRERALVGRDRERKVLRGALETVRREGLGRVVVVAGAAGLGKSRLARDLIEVAEEAGEARCARASWGRGGGGLRGLVERLLGSTHLDRGGLERRLRVLFPGDARATRALCAECLEWLRPRGLGGAGLAPGGALRVIMGVLERAARRRPTCLWLDDAQWEAGAAGSGIVALCGAVAAARAPLLLVVCIREGQAEANELVAALRARASAGAGIEVVGLAPLSDAEVRAMIAGLGALDDAAAGEIARHAAGNPLWATELARHVGASDDRPSAREWPDGLAALWQWRLDRAVAVDEEREALRALALLAEPVERALVGWLGEALGAVTALRNAVAGAAGCGLLREADAGLEWTHGLLRDWLADEAGAAGGAGAPRLHRACAAALARAALAAKDPLRFGYERALHLQSSGQPREAAEALRSAAEQSVARGEMQEALRRYQKLLAWGAVGEGRLGLALVARAHGRPDESEAEAGAALSTFRSEGNAGGEARALRTLARTRLQAGRLGEAAGFYRESITAAGRGGVRIEQARSVEGLASCLRLQGDHARAAAAYGEALALAAGEGEDYVIGPALYGLAALAMSRGELEGAARHAEEARVVMERSGGLVGLMAIANVLGDVHRRLGRHDAARTHYLDSLAHAEAIDMPGRAMTSHLNLAQLALAEGDLTEAERQLDIAEPLERISGSGFARGTLLALRAQAAAVAGREAGVGQYIEALRRHVAAGGAVDGDIEFAVEAIAKRALPDDLRAAVTSLMARLRGGEPS